MSLTKEEYQMVVFLCNCVYKALACGSGSRKSELLRFKVSFFDDKNKCFDGQLYKTPVPIITKGKGRKEKPLEKYSLVHKFQPYLEH